MIAQRLTEVLTAVCPVLGVSIGRQDDKKSWRISFAPEATVAERAAAQAALDAFDPAAALERAEILDELDELDVTSRTTRPVREFVLGSLQLFSALRTANPALPDLSTQPGLVKCREVEQQAVLLRAQLAALP